jgi:hypothetical protein
MQATVRMPKFQDGPVPDGNPRDSPRLEAQMGPSLQPDGSKSRIANGVDHWVDQEHVGCHIR